MNRQLLEIYGTRASKLMPDFWPDYDPRYSSLTLDSVKALIAHANDAAGWYIDDLAISADLP